MSRIDFTVPGEPQGKGRPRVGRIAGHARMFTPEKTAAYEGLIAMAGRQAMAGRPLLTGGVLLTLRIFRSIPASWSKKKRAAALAGRVHATTKPDIDNVEKAVADGLNGVVWVDDVQVVAVEKWKLYAETPCVVVQIVELEGETA
jgi:Holliday junction resolvase RusA-like endonuclease